MKKLMTIGALTLTFCLTSFAKTGEDILIKKKPKLVTYVCQSGYSFEYYEVDGYTQADYEDMQNAVCNDPENQ